jgi:hypothetical protein
VTDGPRIAGGQLVDDGARLRLRLRLVGGDAPVHVLAAARALAWNEAARELTVRISAPGPGEIPPAAPPATLGLDAGAERELAIDLPRVVTRLGPGATPLAPSLSELPVHRAAAVWIELGWSDRAFRADPRPRAGSLADQLARWQRGLARWRAPGL